MRGRSPEEQLAWWNSLTEMKREQYLALAPGALLGLVGLPAAVRQQAEDNYTSDIADDVVTESAHIHGEAEVSIKIFKIGGEFDVEQREYADGSVDIDLSGALKGGVGVEETEALLAVGVDGTWEFDSVAEAEQFKQDLAYAVVRGNLLGFLRDRAPEHLGSIGASVGVEAGVGVDAASVSGGYGVSATVDTLGEDRGDVTLAANASLSAGFQGGEFAVDGSVEVEAAIRFDGTQPQELTFTMQYDEAALTGAFTGQVGIGGGALQSGVAELTFDLTAPAVRSVATQAADALKRGDVAAATRILAGSVDHAQIVVQQFVGTRSEAGFDAKVVSAKLQIDGSTSVTTYIKPPGGTFYELER